jgi:hypothetical protein
MRVSRASQKDMARPIDAADLAVVVAWFDRLALCRLLRAIVFHGSAGIVHGADRTGGLALGAGGHFGGRAAVDVRAGILPGRRI